MEKVNVLVLMATFNGSNYITDQIQSIVCQKNVKVDIVISDDNSNDDTINIVREKFQHIDITINNPGTGSAANNFIKMIKTFDFSLNYDYVAFSDQDDIWLPQKLHAATDLLVKEKADLYCSNLTKWNISNDTYSLLKKDFPQKKFDYLFEGGSAGCTYVFTRAFAIDLQKFLFKLDSSTWKGFSHDWLVYFFARSRKFSVVIDSNSYIHYRLHDANVHGHLNKLSFATIKEKSKQVFEGYYQNHLINYIKHLGSDTEEYKIYEKFLGNYFQRNFVIWKYNTQLMRDNKKFLIFAVLNLLKLK